MLIAIGGPAKPTEGEVVAEAIVALAGLAMTTFVIAKMASAVSAAAKAAAAENNANALESRLQLAGHSAEASRKVREVYAGLSPKAQEWVSAHYGV